MSKKFFFLPALLLGAFLMFTPSCGETDPCKDVECGANGDCFEGECVCNVGYELGTSGQCDTEMRTKFIGTYNIVETCVATNQPTGTYSSTIAVSSDNVSTVTITNFGDSGVVAKGTIDKNKITITSFKVGTIDVTGTGTIDGKILTLEYTGNFSNCKTFKMVMTKL
jgi:hypothetical protein